VKRFCLILVIFLAGSAAFGQQMPLYSQYLYNKFLINPAVAGSDGYTSVSLTARQQWLGYVDAPRTFSFSVQSRTLKKSYILKHTSPRKDVYRPKSDGKVGLGGYVFSDRNGLIERTGVQVSYAYHIWIQQSTQWSLGISATGYHYKINEKEINFEDPNDPLLSSSLRKGIFVPDITFGTYLLNAKYSLGFSADQLLQAAAKIGEVSYKNFKMSRQYYLFGSYDFQRNRSVVIQPSFMVMMSEQVKPQADIGVTYIYNEDFWAGLSFRTSGAIIANLGFKYQNIFIGYAFDFTLQEIQRVTYGTHEITFALKFGDNTRRYRWLDRY